MTWPDGRVRAHGCWSGSSMSFAARISSRSAATGILAGCRATQPSSRARRLRAPVHEEPDRALAAILGVGLPG